MFQNESAAESAAESAPALHLELFNTRVTPLTAPQVNLQIEGFLKASDPKVSVVANHNLHSLYVHEVDPRFRRFYEDADLVLIDGFPVLLSAAAAQRKSGRSSLSSAHRVGSLDWVMDVGNIPGVQRVALVGSSPHSNEIAARLINESHEHLEVRGWHGSEWNTGRAAKVVDELAEFQPQVTFVALGMPLQEHFISEYRAQLTPGVYATVGGALDQIAGVQKAAPRWLGKFGLEWLWRLATQPNRLFHRYVIEPWHLALLVVIRNFKQRTGRRN
ncbi:WecB/TagA/CpsF family glycosyltransferase [Pseudarthrobacter equi]|uniref:WecB/TagA/CpsF family glycosyltransferase n=1 Tax=Pseudarthrobacter equi TaxID=728066 RepID=UPI0028D09FE9|nr:WecB/TagA/CpsF family glycosyltransferase [Pseudarthrobacter equi]